MLNTYPAPICSANGAPAVRVAKLAHRVRVPTVRVKTYALSGSMSGSGLNLRFEWEWARFGAKATLRVGVCPVRGQTYASSGAAIVREAR